MAKIKVAYEIDEKLLPFLPNELAEWSRLQAVNEAEKNATQQHTTLQEKKTIDEKISELEGR